MRVVIVYIIEMLLGALYIYFSRKPHSCFIHLDDTVITILAWAPVVFYLYFYKITWLRLVISVLLGVLGLVFYFLYLFGLLVLFDYKDCEPNYFTSHTLIPYETKDYEHENKHIIWKVSQKT